MVVSRVSFAKAKQAGGGGIGHQREWRLDWATVSQSGAGQNLIRTESTS